ncbi:hypothetical protein [Streptomyces kaniharaensis]|uniref:hypothetical protein n=1 Tax=Streptomyces kaniharaensis TaxID=212423 RepID=UPI0018A86CFF|nr:hypothetical protein [Streptomyces kaniharaensis]
MFLTLLRRAAAATAGWAHRHRDVLVRYALPAAAGAALPVSWYRPGHHFATGDVGPFVRANLTAELGSIWGHQTIGAGGPSYEVARLPDVVLIKLCELTGLGAPFAQLLLYALILGAAAAGTSYLASCWLSRPVAAASAGVLSVVNAYQLVSLLNPLPALAGALTAFLGGHLLRAAQGRRVRVRTVALTTLPLCYLGMNPPLLAVVALGVVALGAACVPLTGGRLRPVLVLVLRAAPVALGLQLWWLVPELVTLQGGGGGTSFSAQTNVQAWTWTQARNTLGNIVALNAHWGWSHPEYYPFAPAMDRQPWAALRWAVPLLALLGAALPPGSRRTKWAMRGLAAVGGVLVLLCKGLHSPLAGLNGWLYSHVPGMWLFREPMSKFGVLLVLVVALLAGAAVQRALDEVPTASSRWRGWSTAVTGTLVAVAIAYPWPLWTGALVSWPRPPLPSASVAVPAPWLEIAKRANTSGAPGKVLELPLQSYYQSLTTWGYHGADTVPQQLLTRPLLQRLPGGYFDSSPRLAELLTLVEQSLGDGETDTAIGALRALDVGQVIIRHDLTTTPGDLPTADADKLGAALAALPGVRRSDATEVADLYELPAPARQVDSLVLNRPTDAKAAAEAAAKGAATTDDPTAPVDGARLAFTTTGSQSVDLRRAGDYRVSLARPVPTSYLPEYRSERGSSEVLLSEAQKIVIDGAALPTGPALRIPLTGRTDTKPAALLVGQTMHPWQPGVPVGVGLGESVAVAVPDGGNLVADQSRQSDGGCGGEHPGRPVERGADGSWSVRAVSGTSCITLPLRAVPDDGLLSVSLTYRTVSGDGPRVCLWQAGPDTCATARRLPADPGWQTWTAAVRVEPGTDSLRLYGYADGVGSQPGIVEYRDPVATALRVAGSVKAPASPPADVSWHAAAGRHVVEGVQPELDGSRLALSGLQDCGRRDDRGYQATGLSAARLGATGVRLEAKAHAACVTVLAGSADPGTAGGTGSYRISLRYRTLSGSPARLCLWQDGPNRCALLPHMVDSAQWNSFETVLTVRPGTVDTALYLYADGTEAGTTVVEYDDIRFAPVASPLTVKIDPDKPAAATGGPRLTRIGAADYRVNLAGVDGAAVVALPESSDTRWRLTGLPAGWTARPVEADGYRAAWLVSGKGDAELRVDFGPDRWWRWAVGLSAVLLLAMVEPLLRHRWGARRSPAVLDAEPVRTAPSSAASERSGHDSPEALDDSFPRQAPADLGGRSDQGQHAAGDETARLAGESGLPRRGGAGE